MQIHTHTHMPFTLPVSASSTVIGLHSNAIPVEVFGGEIMIKHLLPASLIRDVVPPNLFSLLLSFPPYLLSVMCVSVPLWPVCVCVCVCVCVRVLRMNSSDG